MSFSATFYKPPYIYLGIDYADSPGLLKFDPVSFNIVSNYLIENVDATPSYIFTSNDD